MAEGDRPGDRGGDVHGHQVNIGAMHGNIGQIGDTYVLPGRDYRPPFQMPPRPVHFTGRTGVLATLKARLQPGQDVTLHGAGGIGKTALAAEALWQLQAARELAERFPDGVVFHSFENRPATGAALEHIALSLGEENPRPDEAAAAQRALSGRQVLLVLDAAEQAAGLEAVRAVAGGAAVLVTTRDRSQTRDHYLPLDPLPPDEALALLQEWAGEYAADETAAREISELVGRLPLALRLAGRYLAHHQEPAPGYLDWLRQTPLAALDHGHRGEDSVPLLLQKSLDQVTPAARHLVAIAGRLAFAPIPATAFAAALGYDNLHELRRPLAALTGHGLLTRDGDFYQLAHALIHTYARRRLDPDPAALARLARFYTMRTGAEGEAGAGTYLAFVRDRPHMMALLPVLQEGEQWEEVLALAGSIDDHLAARGDAAGRAAGTVLSLGQELIGSLSPLAGLVSGLLAPLASSGTSYLFDRFSSSDRVAVAEAALTAARASGRRREEAAWLEKLGRALWASGRWEEAPDRYKEALDLYRTLGNRERQAALLGSLAETSEALGRAEAAIGYYETALALRRELGDRPGAGQVLFALARLYQGMGQTEEALAYGEQALVLLAESDPTGAETVRVALEGWRE